MPPATLSSPKVKKRPASTGQRNLVAARLDSLRRVYASDAAIADVLEVTRAQPGRWRKGAEPDPENHARLIALDTVVSLLATYLELEVIPDFLGGINAHLADRSPLFMLRKGRLDEVVRAIQADQAEVYA